MKKIVINYILFILLVFIWGNGVVYATSTPDPKDIGKIQHLTKLINQFASNGNTDINRDIAKILYNVVDLMHSRVDIEGYLNNEILFDNTTIKTKELNNIVEENKRLKKEIQSLIDSRITENDSINQKAITNYMIKDYLLIISLVLMWLFFLCKVSRRFNYVFDVIFNNIIKIIILLIVILTKILLLVKKIIDSIYCILSIIARNNKKLST